MAYQDLLKKSVSTYAAAAAQAEKERKEASRLKDEYAEDAIKAINRRLTEKLDAARNEIAAAQAQAVHDVEEWGRIDGTHLPKDAELLKFDIEPGDFDTLVKRHKDNATMQKLLFKYGQQKNDAQSKAGERPTYDLTGISSAQGRAHEVQQQAQHALSVIDMLSGSGYMKGIDSPMARASYKQFIGDGSGYFSFEE